MIHRLTGSFEGRNRACGYKELIFTVATAENEQLNFTAQTLKTLERLEKNLHDMDSCKENLLSVQVFLANIDDKPVMDKLWKQWIGNRPKHWPQRACLGVQLQGNTLIEITAAAVKNRTTIKKDYYGN